MPPETKTALAILDRMPDEAFDWDAAPPTRTAEWQDAEEIIPLDPETLREAVAALDHRKKIAGP